MKHVVNIIIIFLILSVAACSPVRTSYIGNHKKSDKEVATAQKSYNYKDDRFLDTTVIVLDPITPSANNPSGAYSVELIEQEEENSAMAELYSTALEDFDNKQYETAAANFSSIIEEVDRTNPLFFDAMFYLSETKTVKNNFSDGETILLELYEDTSTPAPVMEKVLVRLGQIQCLRQNEELANYYFSRLKIEYPESRYITLANCSFLKK